MLSSKQIKFIQTDLCNQKDKLWLLFNTLSDCTRYRMVKVLMFHRNVSVTDLANICQVSVPAASQHLRQMEEVNLVVKKRYGQTVCYELNLANTQVANINKFITDWLKTSG